MTMTSLSQRMMRAFKTLICRDFTVGSRRQNISVISFEDIDYLRLDIQDIDYDVKEFVLKSVRSSTLTGYLEHPSTRVSFYLLKNVYDRGDITFSNFASRSLIHLINIQVQE